MTSPADATNELTPIDELYDANQQLHAELERWRQQNAALRGAVIASRRALDACYSIAANNGECPQDVIRGIEQSVAPTMGIIRAALAQADRAAGG